MTTYNGNAITSRDIQDAVVLVTSADPNNRRFGTGFIVHQDENNTYLLTCAHVVRDVGGVELVMFYNLPATVIGIDIKEHLDIAVLKVVGSLVGRNPLRLGITDETGKNIIVAGFQEFGKQQQYLLRPIRGKLGGWVGIDTRTDVGRVDAWDLIIEDNYLLQLGYSGSPVIDIANGSVLGIVSHRVGQGEKGLAISIEGLRKVWPEIPLDLLRGSPKRTSLSKVRDFYAPKQEDWGSAADLGLFYGRQGELAQLERWIVTDRCRLIAILGIRGVGKTKLSVRLGKGGIGKTDLSLKLAQGLRDEFEYVIWRSLLNAPPVEEILAELVGFLSNYQEINLPNTLDGQILRLLHYLQTHRCLLILDNMEAVLVGSKNAGEYQKGYEGYGQLLSQIGETSHESCLLLNSREKPQEIARLEGKMRLVHSLELGGLNETDGKKIFTDVGSFSGSDEEWVEIIEFYDGNPLALELVAKHINEVFSGNISAFLKEAKPVFRDIYDLLDWHFGRLSSLEREVLYWLAINREPTSLSELKDDVLSPQAKDQISSTLQSLQRRLPIEKSSTRFTVQPVLIEYMTMRLIEQVGQELIAGKPELIEHMTRKLTDQISEEIETNKVELFNSHALLKSLAPDYVREIQCRLLVKPILDRLNATLGSNVEAKLKQILLSLQEKFPLRPGYAGGNLLNLLCQLKTNLSFYDFSSMTIWQAYLQGVTLQDVNFSGSDFNTSIFTDTFGSIFAVAFSPDGRLLAAGNSNCDIRLWRTTDFKQLARYKGHTDWVRTIAFSPNGKMLASSGGDEVVRLWDVDTSQCIAILQGHTNRVESVAFSPNGKVIASASDDCTIRLWDIATGQCITVLQDGNDWILSVAFSPDGNVLASSGNEPNIRLWDLGTNQCFKTLQHQGRVWSIAFNSDGSGLASGGDDKVIRLWDVNTGECLRVLQGHTGWVRAVAFTPDNSTVGSISEDQTLRVWDVNTGQCRKVLSGHSRQGRCIAFSPDGYIVVSGSTDQTMRLWDRMMGKSIQSLHGYVNLVWSVPFSPNGDLFASSNSDQTIQIWDAKTNHLLRTLIGHTHEVRSVAFGPNSDLLVSGSLDQTIRVWNVLTGKCLWCLQNDNYRVLSVAFSPQGNIIASGGDDLTVRLWDTSTGSLISTLQGHTAPIWAITFSPDGQFVASGGDDETICLWNVRSGQKIRTMHGHTNPVLSIAFIANSSFIATCASDQTIRLWDFSTGEYLKTMQGHQGPVWSIACSPDGTELISGGSDQTIRFWNLTSGDQLKIIQGHTGIVRSVSFCPDGNTIISGSDDGTIKLWNAQTGEHIRTLRGDRPYERMNIKDVTGLTSTQKDTLKSLGAIVD